MLSCRSFIEDSHANIKISPQDSLLVGVRDRLVTLTGTQEELIRAVELILSKLIEDAYYLRSISSPWPYVGMHSTDKNLCLVCLARTVHVVVC